MAGLSRYLTVALALGAALACGREPVQTPPPGGARTVILISVDTLRPERLGVYGNAADVSPAIDALAREATVFEAALSTAPWTLPAHMSMLTGLDPVAHGVRFASNRLSPKVETLAERCADHGFATAAFADGGFVGTGWGFEQGFELFDSEHEDSAGHTGFARYLDRALAWMRERKDEPFFLFLHSFDVHAPYDRCEPEVLARFRARPAPDGPSDHELYKGSFTRIAQEMRMAQYGRMNEVLNDYDAGVHEADLAIARVLATLRETGRWDDALVIVTSDHGESFYDHGLWIGHGINLTDDEIAIPLIVKFPRGEGAGARVATLVDLLDLAPTVLDAAGIAPGEHMQGSSLRELVRGGKRSRSYVFGHTVNAERYFLARSDGLKYITPAGVDVFNVVRPHLQPSNPPVFGATLPGSDFEREQPDGSVVVTRYSEAADPLAFADVFAAQGQLFDRKHDPAETRDLAEARASDARRMLDDLLRRERESQRIADELQEGVAPREMTAHEKRQLAQLGYLAADEAPRVQAPGAAAKIQRTPASDMSRVVPHDRAVHALRLRVRAGEKLGPADVETLSAAAREYEAWGCADPEHQFRMRWRLLELEALARDGGVEFDIKPHMKELGRAFSRWNRERRAADAGAEPDSIGDPDPHGDQ